MSSPPGQGEGQQQPRQKRVSKIMALPLPKMESGDQNGDKPAKKFKKPIVIDKVGL